MNIKKATAQRLLALTALTAITGTRIYRGRLPVKKDIQPPHVIIWRLPGGGRVYDHDGYSGLSEALLQISSFSADPDQADAMAALIIKSMEAWPAETDDIDSVFIEDESEGFEQQTLIHHVPLDVKISYHE